MSKFNEGEIVEVFKTGTPFSVGEKVRLVMKDSNDDWKAEYLDGSDYWHVTEDEVRHTTSNSKENKPMGRRTFKLIKDTPTARKGGLWQEDCEDGTQPYSLITQEYAKGASGPHSVVDRSLIEEAPTWFVEVFKVEPEYMTQVELDKWNLFKKGLKPAKRKYTKRTVKPVKKAVRLSKNGKRLGRPPKAQK